jgi:hypothetical protein
MTVLTDFIEKHIDKDWDWGARGLSSNEQITLKFIEKYIDKGWDFSLYGLSSNKVITLDFINKYPEKGWDFDWLDHIDLFKNKKFDNKLDYDKILDEWNYEKPCSCIMNEQHFSRCIDVYKNFKYINYNFGVFNLSSNKSVDINFIEKMLNIHGDQFHWGLHGLSSNPNLTCDFVEKYIDKEWHWGIMGLSKHLPVNIKFIEKYKNNLNFGLSGLSSNVHLTLETIDYYINELNFYGLSSHPNITTGFIEKYIDKEWNWKMMSCLTFKNEEINRCAKIIQNGVHNWLWKPICNDGTFGINLRLGLNYLNTINKNMLFEVT